MIEKARIVESIEYALLCDIQAISIMNARGYELIKNQFTQKLSQIDKKEKENKNIVDEKAAADFLFHLFAINKG